MNQKWFGMGATETQHLPLTDAYRKARKQYALISGVLLECGVEL